MAEAKTKAEVENVQMEDGRTVAFAGKRKVLKETLIDESKIIVDGDSVTLGAGAVSIRMDFRSGVTRTYPLAVGQLAKFAGHGGEQKFGDELAAPSDKPLSFDDMVLATDELHEQVNVKGKWAATREGSGGGFAGASIVVRAICEATGKTVDQVKAFLAAKLESTPGLTRNKLYDAFRNPNTATGKIIKRMEEEKLSKESALDADEALAALR